MECEWRRESIAPRSIVTAYANIIEKLKKFEHLYSLYFIMLIFGDAKRENEVIGEDCSLKRCESQKRRN